MEDQAKPELTKGRKVGLVLAVVFLILINGGVYWYLQARSHDLKVLGDIAQIRSALDLYYSINTKYPESTTPVMLANRDAGTEKLCIDGFATLSKPCRAILGDVPSSSEFGYTYQTLDKDNLHYQIIFTLKLSQADLGYIRGENKISF